MMVWGHKLKNQTNLRLLHIWICWSKLFDDELKSQIDENDLFYMVVEPN